jgi:alkylhydroperoxidase family enzyme
MVGLEDNDISTSRLSLSDDVKVDAALKFARTIVVSQGEVSDEQINRLRQVGYSDAQIIEIIANVVLNIFTNYFNNIAQTVVDFPKVEFSSKKVGIN